MKDKYEDGDEENFRTEVLKEFNEEVQGNISKVATISNTDFDEVKSLIADMKGMGDFTMPEAKDIASVVCKATGVKPEDVPAETAMLEESNKRLQEALIEANKRTVGREDNFKGIHL